MTIVFRIHYQTTWGQKLYVSGSASELGNWDLAQALEMQHIADGWWELSVDIPADAMAQYKYVLKHEFSSEAKWEWGDNRILFPGNVAKLGLSLVHVDSWKDQEKESNVFFTEAFTDVILKRNYQNSQNRVSDSSSHLIQLYAPQVPSHLKIGILGSSPELGNWQSEDFVEMDDSDYPLWKASVNMQQESSFAYKYVLVDPHTQQIVQWEEGGNREFATSESDEELLNKVQIITDNEIRLDSQKWRGTGVAIPVFSLKSENSGGVGEFLDIKHLADWADSTGITMIQILPINDTVATHTWVDSYPYAAISVFGLHPIYTNIPAVAEQYGLSLSDVYESEVARLNELDEIDYEGVMKMKSHFLKELFDQAKEVFLKEDGFISFFKEHKDWLIPYAAFSYLRDLYGTASYKDWPFYSDYDEARILELVAEKHPHHDDIAIHYFIQYHLHLQLLEAVDYAHERGIVLKGDLPIGIYRNSVDAWVAPHLYHMDSQAGAPPDDFAAKGQNWRFPTYNWEVMAQDDYKWWRQRLSHMANYFDAYRIDHILGFFRIWEIPGNQIEGLLGHFNPALPLHVNELNRQGLYFDYDRYTKPYIRGHFLEERLGMYADWARETFLDELVYSVFQFKTQFDSQRAIADFIDKSDKVPESDKAFLKDGLLSLLSEVIFIPDEKNPHTFHPRIAMQFTRSFQELDSYSQMILNRIYDDFYYHRHEQFWKEQAMVKLPAITSATRMLVCGEDLGMVPACVPSVMRELGILGLEIQRMPKDPKLEFGEPWNYPYLSVCSPSTHDMSPVRAWWEENRTESQRFFNLIMGREGAAPFYCEPWIANEIIAQHMYSPSMWAVFPIQDLLATDSELRRENPMEERINVPSNPENYWRYRMHVSIEELKQASDFNTKMRKMIIHSGRSVNKRVEKGLEEEQAFGAVSG